MSLGNINVPEDVGSSSKDLDYSVFYVHVSLLVTRWPSTGYGNMKVTFKLILLVVF